MKKAFLVSLSICFILVVGCKQSSIIGSTWVAETGRESIGLSFIDGSKVTLTNATERGSIITATYSLIDNNITINGSDGNSSFILTGKINGNKMQLFDEYRIEVIFTRK